MLSLTMSTLLVEATIRHEAQNPKASIIVWPQSHRQARLAVIYGDAHVAFTVAAPCDPPHADRLVADAVAEARRISGL